MSDRQAEIAEVLVIVVVPFIAVIATAVYLLGGPWLSVAGELAGMLFTGGAIVVLTEK